MKKGSVFLFSLHRITGTFICLLFLMWFVSGLVLIYHPFPNVSQKQKYEKMDALPDSLPAIGEVLKQLPDSAKTIKGLSVRYFQEQALFTIRTKAGDYTVCGEESQVIKPVTCETIDRIVKQWVDAPVLKIDTLNKRDIWIMYSRYLQEMPIFKYHFDDPEKHQLYIASRSGEVQQFTNKEQRFFAWVGSIPHKLYIPALRENTDNWILALTIGGVIALIAALSGLYIGVSILRKRYRVKKKWASPYKKSWYKWHHVSGLIFGIFLITFAFSGAMALRKIPQWVIKTYGDYRVTDSQLRGKPLPVEDYVLDYRMLKEKYPQIKRIEWANFQNIPIYHVVVGDQEMCLDASSSTVRELYISKSTVEKAVSRIHHENEPFTVTLISEYEEYYLSRKGSLALPVYKVEVDNKDQSRYYIDPKTGDFNYLNKSRKAKKWVFSGLHYLNIKWLVERPVWWTITIWTICLGGIVICLSGTYLGFRYLRRIIKRKINGL
jgi:uncharacterized iron-regulated membrane protein